MLDNMLIHLETLIHTRIHKKPCVIGVQGIQGSGKSTLVSKLCARNPTWRCASIDDFYLPYKDLLKKATQDPLWSVRGNPGTHEVALIIEVLDAFLHSQKSERPIYDKRIYAGRGDRVGYDEVLPGDVLLLEGWCIGFQPTTVSSQSLQKINDSLKEYVPIWIRMETIIVLKPPCLQIVYAWRQQSEQKMSQQDVEKFVDKYIPSYETYLPELYRSYVSTTIELTADRCLRFE